MSDPAAAPPPEETLEKAPWPASFNERRLLRGIAAIVAAGGAPRLVRADGPVTEDSTVFEDGTLTRVETEPEVAARLFAIGVAAIEGGEAS